MEEKDSILEEVESVVEEVEVAAGVACPFHMVKLLT